MVLKLCKIWTLPESQLEGNFRMVVGITALMIALDITVLEIAALVANRLQLAGNELSTRTFQLSYH